ncbi:hypothetical protein pb186bvf_009813 [Paramecium bursaria]
MQITKTLSQDPWATVFCGIVEASIMANKSEQLQMFLQNKNKFLTWIEQKTYQNLEILMIDNDLNTFYNNLDLEGASGLMKQFIYFKLQVNAPPVLNQDILKQLSAQFLIDIYYKSPNTSIAVQSSSNMNIQLQISYNNQNYSLTLLEKSQQFNNIQQDPFGQECTGCLKLLNIRDQQRSTICQHIYCGQCLKIYFKIGMQFKCRDFFCGKQLCREDFPLFQMSPVRFEQPRKICLSCNQVNGELFANRCGHVYCKKCLSDKLFQPRGFQTQFCLDVACTELLDQHIINLFSKPKESCQICLTEKQNLIKNDCGHLFCRICIRIKYQEQITIGLLPEIECPICSKPLNLKKLYDQQVPQINQPQSSIPVIINRNNRAMSDSQSVPQEQPAQQPQPSGRIFVERTNTRIHSRIQNPLARSLVREREQPAADQTPRRGLPQSYAFGIMRQPNLY